MKCFGYTLIPCEMGSEGYSSWADFGIYEGSSIVDIVQDFIKKTTDGEYMPSDVDIRKAIKLGDELNEFYYHDYFTTFFTVLPEGDIYGSVGKIKLEFPVNIHKDSAKYDQEKEGVQSFNYIQNLCEEEKSQ